MIDIVSLKRKLINFYINSRGWRTNRKFVVIESDDWGSIRMPSKQVYDALLLEGYPVDKLSYLKYDSLESNADLESLFAVLTSFRDKNGNHPIITANTIMTNPDFDKIRQSGFRVYQYELFTETLKRYPAHNRVFELYKQGIKDKIFVPQLHGLEHLNSRRWMKSLQDDQSTTRLAFDNYFFDMSVSHTQITEDSYMDALSYEDPKELEEHRDSVIIASDLFEKTFGYRSKTFIAPCYTWHPLIEESMKNAGINMVQGASYQKIPKMGHPGHFNKKIHYTGEVSKNLLLYSVRNAYFEPVTSNVEITLEKTMSQVNLAFYKHKPAIICSHRVNYIGMLDEQNRNHNLSMLNNLFTEILKAHPETEFIHSGQLVDLILEAGIL